MRRVLFALGAACLACTGATTPPEPPEGTTPEQTQAQAPSVPVEAREARRDVAAWVPQEKGCAFTLFPAAGPSKVLGQVEGECPPSWTLSTSARRRKSVASLSNGKALLIDLDGQTSTVQPPPSVAGWLEAMGYDASGTLLALMHLEAEVVEDEAKEKLALKALGEEFPIEWSERDYAAGFDLCATFAWAEGRWTRQAVEPITLAEGTAPPFCLNYSDLPKPEAMLDPSYSGGHGVMVEARFPPEIEAGLDAMPLPGADGWTPAFEQDPSLPYAMGRTWLEGYSFSSPLLFKKDGKWAPVEGFDKPGSLTLTPEGDRFLACDGEHSAVVRTADAHIERSIKSPLCAIWWPPAAQ